MHMPVLNGFETVRRLRERGFKRPVIALTAYAMVEERRRCFEAGCDDFLSKPVDAATLVRTLERWCAVPVGAGP
jgi:CheY-like chemotaxis protein